MSSPLWKSYRHFGEFEAWGDPSKMQHELLSELDEFRTFLGRPMTVLCGTQGVHAKFSKHYKGEAVDITLLDPKALFDAYLAALRFKFTGIGLYPHWKYNGVIVGGMHLELANPAPPRRLFWLGVHDEKTGLQAYEALNSKTLSLYKLI